MLLVNWGCINDQATWHQENCVFWCWNVKIIYLPTYLSVCLPVCLSTVAFFCFKILVVIACQNLKGTNQRSAIYIALSTTNPAPGPRGPRGLGSVFNKGTSLSRLSPSPSFALRNTLATSQNAAIESVSLHLPSISTYQLERSGKIRKIRLLLHHLRQVLTANFEDSPAKPSQAASDEISKCAPWLARDHSAHCLWPPEKLSETKGRSKQSTLERSTSTNLGSSHRLPQLYKKDVWQIWGIT